MTEDLFRIVVTIAVALACLAFVVQAIVALMLYRVARKMQQKVETVTDKAAPVI